MGTITGSSATEIEAPIERVWDVVEDVLSAQQWQGGLKGMRELERDHDGHVTLAESASDAKVRTINSTVRTINSTVRFAYDGPNTLRWRQEKGELKSVDGSWELQDLGDSRSLACSASATGAHGRRTASRWIWAACSAWSSGVRWSTCCAVSSSERARPNSRNGWKTAECCALMPVIADVLGAPARIECREKPCPQPSRWASARRPHRRPTPAATGAPCPHDPADRRADGPRVLRAVAADGGS
jgi:hypothetical protein